MASISIPSLTDVAEVVRFLKQMGHLAPDYAVPTGSVAVAFILWVILMFGLLYKWLK